MKLASGISSILLLLCATVPATAQNFTIVLDGDARPASSSRTAYEFQCDGKAYAITLEKLEPSGVRLVRLVFPQGALAQSDRPKVDDLLTRFDSVSEIKLNCRGDRGYFEITGDKRFGNKANPTIQEGNTLLDFENGHVTDVSEFTW